MLSLTTIFSAILLGSMLFFAGVVAPSMHRSLGENEALTYSRSVFPKYYLWGIAMSALTTVMAIAAGSYTFILLIVVLIGFLYSRQVLLRKISDAKDHLRG